MLNVHDYLAIRVAHQHDESKRSIARRLHHSQATVAKAIASPTGLPDKYRRKAPAAYPKLGPFVARIDAILEADESAPPKQRHTAMQVYRRLVSEEGYDGKYDQVRRYVRKHRRERRQTLVPLDHAPGERIECDFGQVAADYPDGRRVKDVLVVAWSFSHAVFMISTPNQRTESVLHGMVAALEFFGCCAREVWWDNPKTIATVVLRGRQRKLNDDYAALASHYRFDPRACMPARGQEKPDAESGVKALQRRACTPVPRVKDDAELNAHLLAFCRAETGRTVSGQAQSIGARFELEKRHAVALPAHRFDPCVTASVLIDKYQTATFEHNRYSVPKWAAFRPAALKAYVDRVEVVQDAKVIASHARSYEKDRWVVEPTHYVAALSARPHALDHSNVFRDWALPAAFGELRKRLEREHGENAGIRQYVRVLQMLTTHPAARVAEAVRRLWHRVHLRAEHVQAKADEIAAAEGTSGPRAGPRAGPPTPPKTDPSPARKAEAAEAGACPDGGSLGAGEIAVETDVETGAVKNVPTTGADSPAHARPPGHPRVHVPRPDLKRFNRLLSSYPQGEPANEADEHVDDIAGLGPAAFAAAQPQGVAVARDAGRA
jgi:transposase